MKIPTQIIYELVEGILEEAQVPSDVIEADLDNFIWEATGWKHDGEFFFTDDYED